MNNLQTKNSDIRWRIMEYEGGGKTGDNDDWLTDCCHSTLRGFVATFQSRRRIEHLVVNQCGTSMLLPRDNRTGES